MRTRRQDSWPVPTCPPTIGDLREDLLIDQPKSRRGLRSFRRPLFVAVFVAVVVVVGSSVVSSGSGATVAHSDNLSRAESLRLIAQAEISTVRLAAKACPGAIRGSGFVVEDLLFTAKHLVTHDDRVKVDRPGRPAFAPIVGASAELDIAVARADDLVAIPLTMAGTDPVASETVLVAGFPDGDDLVAAESSVLRYAIASEWGLPGRRVMLLEAEIRKGFSGGPVLNRDGELVGILIGLDQLTGLAVAIPADELREIVELAGTTWSSPEGTSAVTHTVRPCSN